MSFALFHRKSNQDNLLILTAVRSILINIRGNNANLKYRKFYKVSFVPTYDQGCVVEPDDTEYSPHSVGVWGIFR